MRETTNGDVRIHYEVEGDGPVLRCAGVPGGRFVHALLELTDHDERGHGDPGGCVVVAHVGPLLAELDLG
jgi:hypothetical protein